MLFTRIQVTLGAGPNAGVDLITGDGVSGQVFSQGSVSKVPLLNMDLAAGDVLEIEINGTFAGSLDENLPFNLIVAYKPGLSGLKPLRFLTPTGPGNGSLGVGLAGTPASATLTVVVAPLAPGDTVELRGKFDNFNMESQPINLGGLLTGVAGARTPGSNDFDATLGTPALVRDELLAALNDPLNMFAGTWSFAPSGVSAITILRLTDGPLGNYDLLAGSTGNLLWSGFGGGTYTVPGATATIAGPAAAALTEAVIYTVFYNEVDNPLDFSYFPATVGPAVIGGSTVPLGPFNTQPNVNLTTGIPGSEIPIPAAAVILVPMTAWARHLGFLVVCAREV